jgi:hypothetical protein
MLRKNLDRNGPIKPRVPRPIHLSHPASAERREDLLGSELASGRERHDGRPMRRSRS